MDTECGASLLCGYYIFRLEWDLSDQGSKKNSKFKTIGKLVDLVHYTLTKCPYGFLNGHRTMSCINVTVWIQIHLMKGFTEGTPMKNILK